MGWLWAWRAALGTSSHLLAGLLVAADSPGPFGIARASHQREVPGFGPAGQRSGGIWPAPADRRHSRNLAHCALTEKGPFFFVGRSAVGVWLCVGALVSTADAPAPATPPNSGSLS